MNEHTPENGMNMDRRKMLKMGLMAGSAAALPLQSANALVEPKDDTNVIFIWLPGGLPHMDMYDMKPDAPLEYRGIFSPIKTNVPEIQVSELMPMHAKIADKFSIIRSMHHDFSDHGGGSKRFMMARDPKIPNGTINDSPAISAVIKQQLGPLSDYGMPSVIGLGYGSVGTMGPAWLGQANAPFLVPGDPSSPSFKVANIGVDEKLANRLTDRMMLLEGFDKVRRDIDGDGTIKAIDKFNDQALAMLTSEKVKNAFDLKQEPAKVKERYGMNDFGQKALLARRLVEDGARFVNVNWSRPFASVPKTSAGNWDCHSVNCHLHKDLEWRLPPYDKALTALIEDIYQRGMDKNTMIVVTGEFGHTPKINPASGTKTGVLQPGRDHWPKAMSVLVSGGGTRTGQVIGATNSKGEYPVDRAMTPNDLWVNMLHHLGIDHNLVLRDELDRPIPVLPHGKVIKELQTS